MKVAPEITDNPDETPEAVDPALTASASPGVSSSPSASATPIPANSSKPYLVRVYLGSQSVCVYGLNSSGTAYDRLVRSMICSTGTGGATPQGTFKLQGKYRWHSLMGGVYGQYCSRITGSILFHSILYKVNGDPSTLNETTYKKLGRKASHGCIRLLCGDAYWIYSNVASGSHGGNRFRQRPARFQAGFGQRLAIPRLGSYRPAANNPYRGYVEPTHTPTHTPTPATPTPTHTVKPTHAHACARNPDADAYTDTYACDVPVAFLRADAFGRGIIKSFSLTQNGMVLWIMPFFFFFLSVCSACTFLLG
ncbi:MAG: L,D-transpeptidase [Christensenellales bacterium]